MVLNIWILDDFCMCYCRWLLYCLKKVRKKKQGQKVKISQTSVQVKGIHILTCFLYYKVIDIFTLFTLSHVKYETCFLYFSLLHYPVSKYLIIGKWCLQHSWIYKNNSCHYLAIVSQIFLTKLWNKLNQLLFNSWHICLLLRIWSINILHVLFCSLSIHHIDSSCL